MAQTKVIWEVGASVKKMLPEDQAAGEPVGISLISDWWGKAQTIVGGAISGQVVLGSTKNMTEQAMEGK